MVIFSIFSRDGGNLFLKTLNISLLRHDAGYRLSINTFLFFFSILSILNRANAETNRFVIINSYDFETVKQKKIKKTERIIDP